MNRVVYCLFFSLLKVTLPSVIFNPEVQEQLYEFNISFTRGDQKVRGKVLLNRIAFIDCNEN